MAHGALFVPDEWRVPLADILARARDKHSYRNEIHYREIKTASRHALPFQVAKEWISDYLSYAIKGCPFKVFITENDGPRRFPYPGESGYPEHLLMATKAVFKGGLAWSYSKERQVRLAIVSDETDAEVDRSVLQQLPDVLQLEWNTRASKSKTARPWLRVERPRMVPSDPLACRPSDRIDSDFIQLCDLMLGATFEALDLIGPSNKAGRRALSQSILEVIGQTIEVPWLQQIPVHRRFSASIYPDSHNLAYPAALRYVRKVAKACNPRLPGFS